MRCLTTMTLLLAAAAGRVAADDSAVYTDPAAADADFAFQGEYRGFQRPQQSHRSSVSVGLQVVARGEGRFDAVKSFAGLPGELRYRKDRYEMSGERTGDVLHLIGEQYDVIIQSGVAELYTKDGDPAGTLQRVERVSPTMGLAPPAGAIVLFDGTDTGRLKNPRMTDEGWLLAGSETTNAYQSFRLHAEFRLPYKPAATGQARGNSGFYLQRRYEVQVLDSFGLEGVFNECGALYRQRPPDLNMCLPPLQWQTYDIDFRAAQFDASGAKTDNARISVWQNGVAIHRDVEVIGTTGNGRPEGPEAMPILMQDHQNPVVFRNIWLLETSEGWEPPRGIVPPVSVTLAGP